MDKLTMAHEFMMKKMETETIDNHWELFYSSWRYADAMQTEAEKREPSGLPESLCEVDWRVAPSWAKYWAIRDGSQALWCASKPTCTDDCLMSNGSCSPAPSFGFTGTHIMERPHGF